MQIKAIPIVICVATLLTVTGCNQRFYDTDPQYIEFFHAEREIVLDVAENLQSRSDVNTIYGLDSLQRAGGYFAINIEFESGVYIAITSGVSNDDPSSFITLHSSLRNPPSQAEVDFAYSTFVDVLRANPSISYCGPMVAGNELRCE